MLKPARQAPSARTQSKSKLLKSTLTKTLDLYLHDLFPVAGKPHKSSSLYDSLEGSPSRSSYWSDFLLLLFFFYSATIESILTTSISIWFPSASALSKSGPQCVIHSAERIIGHKLPCCFPSYSSFFVFFCFIQDQG